MANTFRQPMLDVMRQMQTTTAGSAYDPNTPIPRPGQPTNTQITPLPFSNNVSPGAMNYINQDINAFNAPQAIPGLTGIAPPQQQFPYQQQMPTSGFRPAGPYGRQALGLAGLLSANTPPGDTYPNGLLGKRPFRPGGK